MITLIFLDSFLEFVVNTKANKRSTEIARTILAVDITTESLLAGKSGGYALYNELNFRY